MKKLVIAVSLIGLFSFSFASDATIGVNKLNNNEINMSLNSNADVYGLQFDACAESNITYANVKDLYTQSDSRSDMSIHYAIRENGCVRVIMFSLTGQPIAYKNNVEEVMNMQLDQSKVEVKNIVIAGENGRTIDSGDPEYVITTPTQSKLIGNYPNPFNPSTTIEFNLTDANSGLVNVVIYDLQGRKVQTLYNGWLDAGFGHKFVWNASSVASGKYFAVLSAPNGFTDTVNMTLIK